MILRVFSFAIGVLAVGAMLGTVILVLPPESGRPSTRVESVGGVDLAADVSIHGLDEIGAAQAHADSAATGVIALRSQRTGLVDLRAADGRIIGPERPVFAEYGRSSNSAWQAFSDCSRPTGCNLQIAASRAQPGQSPVTIDLLAPYVEGEWAPASERLAALDSARNLYLLAPIERAPKPLMSNVTNFAWAAGDVLVFATETDGRGVLWKAAGHSAPTRLAEVDGLVDRLFPSTDLSQFAFAVSDPAGWRLLAVSALDGALKDFGHLGASATTTLAEVPAFSIAWSPDSTYLAVGPVTDTFTVHIATTAADLPVRSHRFGSGYAGELKWSPDGNTLAISTYAPNRVWHEVYLIDIQAADSQPRFVLDGCEIIWSPAGEYIAVKREPSHATAVAVIRVDSGAYWHLANQFGLSPVAWGTDEKAAIELAQQPVRRASQLQK